MSKVLALIASLLATPVAAQTAAAPAPNPPAQTDVELRERVDKLEHELARLRLSMPDQSDADLAPVATQPAPSPNVFNPTLTVAANAIYRWDDRAVRVDGQRIDSTFNVREVELDFRAPVDPFADAVAIVAFPAEVPGDYHVEIEEAYLVLKRLPVAGLEQPPLGAKLMLGRFRAEAGNVNRLHLHDLPQATRPLATVEWFGDDGYIGNGASLQLLLPGGGEAALVLTAQVLTGGGPPIADGPLRSPAVLGNLSWFRPLGDAHSFTLALITLYGRSDASRWSRVLTYSADLTYKWKPLRGGESRSFVLGAQALASDRRFHQGIDTNGDLQDDALRQRHQWPVGYFAFAQYQLARPVYLGVRCDDTASIDAEHVRRRAVAAYLSWYPSEFLRLRAGYERRISELAFEDGQDSALAEINFIIGAHPPEPFWVNK